jgi:hypothetical protein
MTNIDKAIAYFTSEHIEAYEDDSSVYVTIGDIDLQISTAEVNYRADLYDESKEEA